MTSAQLPAIVRIHHHWLLPLLLWSIVLTSLPAYGTPLYDVTDNEKESEEEERWLADGIYYDYDYFGDQPPPDESELGSDDLCPPVPKEGVDGGCDVEVCSSDAECMRKQLKCCYNGCVYTCLPEVKPAPHIDWIREPRRRLQFGQSWLIPGPNYVVNVEMCSTSPIEDDDDADPLVCPHGYECSIDDPGDPDVGEPNRGHCVKVEPKVITNVDSPCSTSSTDEDSPPPKCPPGYVCSIDVLVDTGDGIFNRGHCVKVKSEVISQESHPDTTDTVLQKTLNDGKDGGKENTDYKEEEIIQNSKEEDEDKENNASNEDDEEKFGDKDADDNKKASDSVNKDETDEEKDDEDKYNNDDDGDVEEGEKFDQATHHACRLSDGRVLLSGHSVVVEGRKCSCDESELVCVEQQ